MNLSKNSWLFVIAKALFKWSLIKGLEVFSISQIKFLSLYIFKDCAIFWYISWHKSEINLSDISTISQTKLKIISGFFSKSMKLSNKDARANSSHIFLISLFKGKFVDVLFELLFLFNFCCSNIFWSCSICSCKIWIFLSFSFNKSFVEQFISEKFKPFDGVNDSIMLVSISFSEEFILISLLFERFFFIYLNIIIWYKIF